MKFYVDMDDVLVDFRGGIRARGVNATGGSFYTNHPSTWTTEQRRAIEATNALCADETFWRELQPARGAFEILSACALRGDTFLLSALPMGDADKDMVRRVKLEWALNRLYVPSHKVIVCERPEKAIYALCSKRLTSNILVDDSPKNVQEWRQAGGVAIRHELGEPGETIQQIASVIP